MKNIDRRAIGQGFTPNTSSKRDTLPKRKCILYKSVEQYEVREIREIFKVSLFNTNLLSI